MDDQTLRPEATLSDQAPRIVSDRDLDNGDAVTRVRDVTATSGSNPKCVYWHRELPPFDAMVMGEHVLEATSGRMPGTLAHRDELWERAYQELMDNAQARIHQEIVRLGGHYAHVLDESIDIRHDNATGEAWLHGRFTYSLSRQPLVPKAGAAT